MTATFAFAVGIRNTNGAGLVLDCLYPNPIMQPEGDVEAAIADFAEGVTLLSEESAAKLHGSNADILPASLLASLSEGSGQELIAIRLLSDTDIVGTEDAYLKLHLLSHRLALPNTLNLNGIFAHLPNLAWTSAGPIEVSELPQALLNARAQGLNLEVFSVDKFPKMVNYVVPTGVRIADASRIRLGAYLGEGTTVMHEGFINFNAGAIGPNMVEGRISQGVTVGSGSDLGGSASTAGTLSGGGNIVIKGGEGCLIGANAGIGIPLADGCVVEAGLYVTAGTKVNLLNATGEQQASCKALELIGQEGLLFRRNSLSGAVECLPLKSEVELNSELHAHN